MKNWTQQTHTNVFNIVYIEKGLKISITFKLF
jgi:hypothetical protein